MDAGIEHSGDDLIDRSLEYLLPFVQEWGSMWIGRPHPGNVSSGDLNAFIPTNP